MRSPAPDSTSTVSLDAADPAPAAAAAARELANMPPVELGRLSGASTKAAGCVTRCERAVQRLAAPLAGTAVVAAAVPAGTRSQTAVLTFVILMCAALAVPDKNRWSSLMPWMGAVPLSAGALLGIALLELARVGAGSPDVGIGVLLLAFLVQEPASALCRAFVGRCRGRARPVRVAVIGEAASATMLERELHLNGCTGHQLVGRVAGGAAAEAHGEDDVPCLGSLAGIDTLVRRHDIDLLLMGSECGRMQVFEAMRACLHLRVRLTELSLFYEEIFGHVPAAEINASWFQYIVHPGYSGPSAAAKRVLDVVGAIVIGLPFLVVLAVLAPLIRRDGGPVFFWQTRVGEGGRPLRLCKLRTMRVDSEATWSSAGDPRVTPIGRVLRRTHLDELPQLLHILRGEMSLVGPRPEQPHIVEQLERDVPFYSSRHLVRPGIAGWAQLRCGYAGSEVGSAWKLCHDLYYLKHRSLAFDLAILGETVRTVFADPHRVPDPTATWFIVGRDGGARKMQPSVAG